MPIGKAKAKKQMFGKDANGQKENIRGDRSMNNSNSFLMDTSTNKMFE